MKFNDEKFLILAASNGMMLKDIAEKAEISTNALRDIRKGKSNPRTATLGKIAKALNVPVTDIVDIEE